jgi:hypothetical protein
MLRVKAARVSGTSVNVYQIARRHITEDSNFRSHAMRTSNLTRPNWINNIEGIEYERM